MAFFFIFSDFALHNCSNISNPDEEMLSSVAEGDIEGVPEEAVEGEREERPVEAGSQKEQQVEVEGVGVQVRLQGRKFEVVAAAGRIEGGAAQQAVALPERAKTEPGQLGEDPARQGHEELPHQSGALRRPGEHPGLGEGRETLAAGWFNRI